MWSTMTQVVQGVLTTTGYTTSTNTITVTTIPVTQIGTTITISNLGVYQRTLSLAGSMKDSNGRPVQSMPVKIYINGAYLATVSTNSAGTYTYYTASGPSVKGAYTVTVVFEGTSNYAASRASKTVCV